MRKYEKSGPIVQCFKRLCDVASLTLAYRHSMHIEREKERAEKSN